MPDLSPGLTAYLLSLTALLGAAAGSFLNCLAWRLAHGESVLKGRSHCALCGHTLGPGELVPLLSYLFLRGRCRWCGGRISPRYPAAELAAMLLFLAIALRWGFTITALRILIFSCILFILSLIDLEIQCIPDGLLAAAIVWYLLTLPLVNNDPLAGLGSGLLGGLAISLPLLGLVLLADRLTGLETMGGGDIKLFFVAGLYLGLPLNLLNLITSCFLGVIFGILARIGKPAGGRHIPFGPAISVGIFLCLLWGDRVISWYLRLFF